MGYSYQSVVTKIKTKSSPPTVDDYDVYLKLKSAKKPQSGVPSDLPRHIVKEFLPELAKPIAKIVNSISRTGQWPCQWKQELVIALGKIDIPETEDDLRPISLTPFFSKVTEQVIANSKAIVQEKAEQRGK